MGWSRGEFFNSLMQKWFYNNILIYLTHNEGKSVVAERFAKTLKGKIYKTVTANDSKSYLGYLNKLVDQYNNTYYHFIGKKPVDADYSALKKVNWVLKLLNLKLVIKLGLILCWKLILGRIKLKI